MCLCSDTEIYNGEIKGSPTCTDGRRKPWILDIEVTFSNFQKEEIGFELIQNGKGKGKQK